MTQLAKHFFSSSIVETKHFLALIFKLLLILMPVPLLAANQVLSDQVLIQPTPDGGLQPRLETDAAGNVHLMYFKKRLNRPDAREGNLYYREYDHQAETFGLPVKISSQAFPLQTVSISRASMAVDSEGRIHAIWYLPKSAQYFYARSNIERTRFEPQRSMVVQNTLGIDAGADIAARGDRVAIFWGAGDLSREYERTVFARISEDGGKNFGPELQLGNPDLGACGCCSLAADFSADDSLLVGYRSALAGVGRHMQLLTLEGLSEGIRNASYGELHELQQWEASFCPLSTNDIEVTEDDLLWIVFETEGRIVQQAIAEDAEPERVAEPFSETRQKNPAIALSDSGHRLIVWAEAISHSRGGRLNMRLIDENSTGGDEATFSSVAPIQLEDFSFPAAAALPEGRFLVLY
ncbi:MAG: hypothetical protein AB8B95_13780 [Pseudohongiellaceae bacterium]